MPTWTDGFERPNGGLGNNWQVNYGGVTIASGRAVSTGYSMAFQTQEFAPERQDVTLALSIEAGTTSFSGPLLKCNDTGGANCYEVWGTGTLLAPVWHVCRRLSLTRLGDYSAGGSALNAGANTVRAVYDSGTITLYVNGLLVLTWHDSAWSANSLCGFQVQPGASVETITLLSGETMQLTVRPSPLGNYGQVVPVSFTGVGANWTPGTPGAPLFTVDHGTLLSQAVGSATAATGTYDPGSFLGFATFTDPSTGSTCQVQVTSDTNLSPPGGSTISPSILEYLQRSADAETNSTILNRNESWTGYGVTKTMSETIETVHNTLSQSTYAVDGQAGILALIVQVYDLLNGGSDWGGTATIFGNTSLIKADVDSLASALADVQGPGGVSLAVLAAALADLRGVGAPSLADVLAASGGGGDSSAVLAAIAAVRGSGSPDLRALADKADSLRTTHGYDLGTVKGWIDALPQAQSGPSAALIIATVAALALAIPTGGASVAAEAVAIGAGPLLDLTTLVEVASVLGEVAGIASSIASLRDSLGTPSLAAPVWPGADLVTLGTSHDLADGLIVDGPMHGLIVTIGGHPSGAGKYTFGSVDSWQHCGAVIFQDDAGHYERAESFGLPSQILTPHTMASAASATVRLNGGWSGTIRGWTVTA